MGQVKSHLTSYFGSDSGKHYANNGDLIQNAKKYKKDIDPNKENSENNSYFPFGIFATPRNPLKRTRQISPTVSLPQSITDIFSPAKKPKIQDDFLDFPFLENNDTIDYFRKSKIMVILRGLPGSGKSTIAKHIQRKHISCKVCSADNFFMKDGEYVYERSLIKEAHSQCQESAIKAVQDQISVVVIDNTNVKSWEMNFYLNLAKQFHYVPLIIESKTPWRTDTSQLVSKTIHDIDEHILELKKNDYDELQPIYYGWFLNEKDSHLFIEEGRVWIETMSKIPEFLNDMQRRTQTKSLEDLLEYYKPAQNGILHCTANFIGKNLSPENKEYLDKCQAAIGKSFDIEVIGFVITPRTLGARIRLSKEELTVWRNDDEEDVPEEFYEDNFTIDDDDDDVNGNADVNGNDDDVSISENLGSTGIGSTLKMLQIVENEVNSSSKDDIASSKINNTPEIGVSNEVVNGIEGDTDKSPVNLENSHSSNNVDHSFDNDKSEVSEVIVNNSLNSNESLNKSWESSDTPKKQNTRNRQKLAVPTFATSPSKKSPRKNKGGVLIPENTISIDNTLTRETVSLVFSNISEETKKFAPTSGAGSRAHLTLGCAPNVKPVTTGLDLIMAIQSEMSSQSCEGETSNQQNANHDNTLSPLNKYAIEGAIVRNYGNGVWVIYLDEIIKVLIIPVSTKEEKSTH